LVFVLVVLAHDRRRIRDMAVTARPTAAWTAQQLREAFPCDEAPKYVIHDRDHAFDGFGATARPVRRHGLLIRSLGGICRSPGRLTFWRADLTDEERRDLH